MDSVRGIAVIVLFFGGSIFVHELGHFLAAKWRGLKVERFSIGFGPRVFGWTGKDGVDYRISLLPLGGYVAIPELADMELIEGKSAQGGAGEGAPAKQISYTDKVIVFAAGAFFNVLFALVLACILWVVKSPSHEGYDSTEIGYVAETIEVEAGVTVPGPAWEAGLRPGDRILSLDGEKVESFDKIVQGIALGTQRSEDGRPQATLLIERDNAVLEKKVFPRLVSHNPRSGDFIRMIGIEPTNTVTVAPQENSPAALAGVRYGDRWTQVATGAELREDSWKTLHSFSEFREIVSGSVGENGVQPVRVRYVRDGGKPEELSIVPKAIPVKSETALIRFKENGTERVLRLIAAPEDLSNTAIRAKRDTLRVLEGLPADSIYAGTFLPGALIDGVAEQGSGIAAPKTPADLKALFPGEAPREISVFVTGPSGEGASVRISAASISLEPEAREAFLGVLLLREEQLKRKSPWQQFSDAFDMTFKSIGGLLNPNSDIGISHLNGVFSIGDTYYAVSSNLRSVLVLTVLININLAILNLLPIPVLDGGHILIATIQRLRRRPISPRVINGVQFVFIFLLLLFMGFVLFKDFARFRGNRDMKANVQIARFQYTPEFLETMDFPVAKPSDAPAQEKSGD
ncbi:MAG: site-2 protease family protein [Opitutales bacterium]|nr:site-2 protease family protein [Opitutales bacterium]